MEFKTFADAVNSKFLQLAETALFRVNVSKELLQETYQSSYPAADNPIFRERRVHECNTCTSFINRLGPVVAIINDELDSIWNIPNLEEPYATVASNMHKLVISHGISSIFLHDERLIGKEYNIEANEAGDIKWDHFYADIGASFVSNNVATERSLIESTVSVFLRVLEEFSLDTLLTVEDLCDTIYKGEEFKPTVTNFIKAKRAFEDSNKTYFAWANYSKYPARIRNSAIGSLIINVNEGMDLEQAVRSYESVVAPSNYKRTTSVATEGMKKQALETIDTLNLRDSLPRRPATLEDISVNNVLFADKSAKAHMLDPLDKILSTSSKVNKPTSATELSIEEFLSDVLPNSTKIEALIENRHTSNFVSLVAPVNPEAPNMLKWDNNFSWSYNGEVTDSLRQKVSAAGGRVDGVFRFSHSWNELEPNQSLMDLHVFMPGCRVPTSGGGPSVTGRRVGWNKRTDPQSGGEQDVDYTSQAPTGYIPVENITFPSISKMPEGIYTCKIHNWSFRNTGGRGKAEIELNGTIYQYEYPATKNHEWITVAEVTLKDGVFTIEHKLKEANSQRTEWDISTLQYQKVSTIMLSPNYWNSQGVGNKHYFFMLEGCKNPSQVRGFYNEFLSNDLTKHRKVFEMLSSAMKCEPSENQLSGVGFSSTLNNSIHLKVDGRPYKINIKG